MTTKIQKLIKVYNQSNKRKYIYDTVEIIDYFEKSSAKYTVKIMMLKTINNYIILMFLDQDEKIIFRSRLKHSRESLLKSYSRIKKDLQQMPVSLFVDKYYMVLKRGIDKE